MKPHTPEGHITFFNLTDALEELRQQAGTLFTSVSRHLLFAEYDQKGKLIDGEPPQCSTPRTLPVELPVNEY